MNAEKFDLIFEGMREDSNEVRDRLRELLKTSGISQIFEIESLLDGGPFLLMRSADKGDLEQKYAELKQAGAQVLLVRSKEKPRQRTRRNVMLELVRPRPVEETFSTVQDSPQSFRSFFESYTAGIQRVLEALKVEEIEVLIRDMLDARADRRNIYVFGNGGSASSASHMANDFAKQRFDDEKYLFRIASLNDNISCLTATANDFGYEYIFVNQLKTQLRPGDVVIGISSSGNSPNIVRALNYAREHGAITYGIVGFNGGEVQRVAQKSVYIPTKVGQYGYMEDVTLIINHMISIYIYEQDLARQPH